MNLLDFNTNRHLLARRLPGYFAVTLFFFGFLYFGLWTWDLFLGRISPFRGVPPKDQTINDVRYTYGHPIILNRLGFRDIEFVPKKNAGLYRVVVLGDSFTYGYGLDLEDTFPKVAEEILQQQFGASVEVLNLSRPGLSTMEEADILKKFVDLLSPDLVVIGFCFNDPLLPKPYSSVDEGRNLFREKFAPLFDFAQGLAFLGFYNVGQRVDQAIDLWGDSEKLQPTWLTPIEHAYDTTSEEWAGFRNALTEIKGISKRRNLKGPIFAVLNQGASHTDPPDYDRPNAHLRSFITFWDQAKREAFLSGYIVYDHIDEIKEQLKGQYLGINAVDWHPSKNLHKVYGEKLADQILKIRAQELRESKLNEERAPLID